MPNSLITMQDIARRALPALEENLLMPMLMHRDYSDDFKSHGDTIQIRKPIVYEAQDFTNETQDQDIVESSVTVTLDTLSTVDVSISAIEGATSIDDVDRLFIQPAARALAKKVNDNGLQLYKQVPTFVGTAGTTPGSISAISGARKALNKQLAPVGGRVAIWDPEAEESLGNLDAIMNAEKSGSNLALRDGSMGHVKGFDHYMAQGVCQHVKGTLATAGTSGKHILLQGAATNAMIITLDTDDTDLTGTLKAGDNLTIGTKKVTVAEDATAANNAITVKLLSPLTAADNATVTIGANYTANMAFVPQAFAFVTRPLVKPAGVESYVTSYKGLSLRMTRGYDMRHKKEMLSMDILYGFKCIHPELALRVLG